MARSCELGRTGGEVPRPAAGAMARSGELPKGAAGRATAAAAVRHEGWMVRYGRRKIGRSFFHTRYFVLDNKLLAYYKKKPKDNMVIVAQYMLLILLLESLELRSICCGKLCCSAARVDEF